VTLEEQILRVAKKSGWSTAPVWSVATRVDRTGYADAELLSVYRDWGVVRKSDRDDNHNVESDDLSAYKWVQRGDLVLNKMKTWQGSLAVSEYEGIVSPAYFVCALKPSVHPKYIHYLLRSDLYIAMYAAASKGIRPNQWDLPYDEFRRLPVLLPPMEEQRRIADFLDDQVARIDDLLRARQAQFARTMEILDSLWDARASRALSAGPAVPLGRVLVSICDGPFGSSLTSGHYTDEGVRVIRLGNIGTFSFRDQDKAYIDPGYAQELVAHATRTGDLVMAGLGDESWPLGRCTVVPEGVAPAIVKADCYRIRLDSRVSHEFAAWYLSSPPARAQFALLARGSTRARLNTGLARQAQLPLVSLAEQDALVREFGREAEGTHEMQDLLDSAAGRLAEYKRSLITAAVTGELDVTTASRGVPA
jgi:type I restriction enzyme S subunit